VLASALAMDKLIARRLFASAGLPVARGLGLARPPAGIEARLAAEQARREIGRALVVKPSAAGSGIGVTRLEGDAPLEDVARAIESVWSLDAFAVVEHFAHGREVTCGVLDASLHGPAVALPPTEIESPRDAFYTYEARYAPGRSVHTCPAALGEALKRFPTGVYAIWYPLTGRVKAAALFDGLRDLPLLPPTLVADLIVDPESARMNGCGLVILNPPWEFDREADVILRALARILAQARGASATVRWLATARRVRKGAPPARAAKARR